jgi:hypothetical protein
MVGTVAPASYWRLPNSFIPARSLCPTMYCVSMRFLDAVIVVSCVLWRYTDNLCTVNSKSTPSFLQKHRSRNFRS